MGDWHNKDWGTSSTNDYRKKRPAYSTYGMHDINEAHSHGKAGWVDYGAMEADDEKAKGTHHYEKKTHEKGREEYDESKWVNQQEGPSNSKWWKVKEPDEEHHE